MGLNGVGLILLWGLVLPTPQILSTEPSQMVSLPSPLVLRPWDILVGGPGGHRRRKEQEEKEEKGDQTRRSNNLLLKKGE